MILLKTMNIVIKLKNNKKMHLELSISTPLLEMKTKHLK